MLSNTYMAAEIHVKLRQDSLSPLGCHCIGRLRIVLGKITSTGQCDSICKYCVNSGSDFVKMGLHDGVVDRGTSMLKRDIDFRMVIIPLLSTLT